MEFEVSKSDGAVVVSLSGEITSREDQDAVAGLLADRLEAGERTFVMDLSDVPYVSSLGIAVLVATSVRIDRAAGELRLVNPRPNVTKVLEMTKVGRMFRTYSSVEEALTADASP